MPKRPWRIPAPDRDVLRRQYIDERWSIDALVEHYGVSKKVLHRWFGLLGLARPKGRQPASFVQANPGGCHIWTGSRDAKGYGMVWVDGAHVRAHRFFYEQAKGPIGRGLMLDHLCRNASCVNPEHLEPVTNAVNVQRGRKAKLTPAVVRSIRRHAKHWNYESLAFLAGVGVDTISKVVNRKSWANV